VGDRIAQEAPDQHVNTGIEGDREQQALTVAGSLVQRPGDLRQEPQVGHVVGLVQHGDLHGVEPGTTGRDVIGQPAGASSRVGARITALGLPERRVVVLVASLARTGNANA
jgi:hypothetical protein